MKDVVGIILTVAIGLGIAKLLAWRMSTSPGASFVVIGLALGGTILWVYTVRRWRRYD